MDGEPMRSGEDMLIGGYDLGINAIEQAWLYRIS